MDAKEMMFLVEENQTIDALALQEFNVIFHMLRPQFIDNFFATNLVVDIFYYLYLEDVPAINSNAASIFVARKTYLDWIMQTKKIEHLKEKTVNKKDKSLIVSVHIVNAIIDAYLIIVKQYSKEDIQFINRFLGHKAAIYSASFLQDQNYPQKLLTLETEICQKVVRSIEENKEAIIKEINLFLEEVLLIEKELFHNIDVPFTIKSSN